ncbi:MAG: hypothetical protein QXP42_01510 [Candidatus Micrarchaeia archaeon]
MKKADFYALLLIIVLSVSALSWGFGKDISLDSFSHLKNVRDSKLPSDFILNSLSSWLGSDLVLATKLFVLACALISICSFFFAVRKFCNPTISVLSAVLLLFTPDFISAFLVGKYSPHVFEFTLAMLGISILTVFEKSQYPISAIGGIALGLACARDMQAALFFFIVFLMKIVLDYRNDKLAFQNSVAFFSAFLIVFLISAYPNFALAQSEPKIPYTLIPASFACVLFMIMRRKWDFYPLFALLFLPAFIPNLIHSNPLLLLFPLSFASACGLSELTSGGADAHKISLFTLSFFLPLAIIFPWSVSITGALLLSLITAFAALFIKKTLPDLTFFYYTPQLFVAILFVSTIGLGALHRTYSRLDGDWLNALAWIVANTEKNATIATPTMSDAVEFKTGRTALDNNTVILALLSKNKNALSEMNASYLLIDKRFLLDLHAIGSNISRNKDAIGADAFVFYGPAKSRETIYAVFISKSGATLWVPLNKNFEFEHGADAFIGSPPNMMRIPQEMLIRTKCSESDFFNYSADILLYPDEDYDRNIISLFLGKHENFGEKVYDRGFITIYRLK